MASPRTQQKTLLDLARAGDAEALQAALASLAPRATKDFFAEKPLHVAAEEGHEEVAKTLILGGIDVNGKDEKGATPLHVAASKGHTSVVTALVTRGATVNGKTNRGSTPLHFAAQEGHEAAAEELIVKGADVNAKDKNGYTPLHLAAFNGHTAMVEMLIGKGAEPNAKGNGGSTPLHFAAQKGHEAAAEELIVKGADVNAKKVNGNTALHIAASQGHLHVLFTLVKLGRNKREERPRRDSQGTAERNFHHCKLRHGNLQSMIDLQIEIMEKYLAAEKGKASLRREYMSFQNEHKKELKSIKEDQRKRDADSQTMKKEIGALKDKIKAIERPGRLRRSISFQEEHKAELRNVAENQQEKEAEILRMQNEIVGLKETVASRDEKIKSLEVR
nr:ankyrin-1-like [Penaeus vannamei]